MQPPRPGPETVAPNEPATEVEAASAFFFFFLGGGLV